MIKLYNTLSRKKESFKPLKKKVGLYTCGPTVYWYSHIGNLRSYVFADVLKRALEFNGYKVKHVINITDVGHLTSDADTGEDKLQKRAETEKKTAWQIAEYYTREFQKDIAKINIKEPSVWVKATDYIQEQIELIEKLEKKGFIYIIEDGVYFDTSRVKNYEQLWGSKKVDLKAGARVEMVEGKKNITDFALWKFTPKKVKRDMEWDSPWGKGFPGWHTECVVMALKNLGVPFDIHTGGIDHIQTHHTNEIAQAKAAYDKKLSCFWMHNNFIDFHGEKMSKSSGKILRITTIEEKGFDPVSYRYLCLNSHYRSKINFSWEAIKGAEKSLLSLRNLIKQPDKKESISKNKIEQNKKEFLKLINNDLDTPRALAFIRKMLKNDNLNDTEKIHLVKLFDSVLGLNLIEKKESLPGNVSSLFKEREAARKGKDWKKADKLRKELEKNGYLVEDSIQGSSIKKIK